MKVICGDHRCFQLVGDMVSGPKVQWVAVLRPMFLSLPSLGDGSDVLALQAGTIGEYRGQGGGLLRVLAQRRMKRGGRVEEHISRYRG